MKKYLLLAILLLIPRPSFATFTRVRTALEWTGAGSIAVPSVGANHVLVLNIATFSFPVTSVSDTNGDTWVHATGAQVLHPGALTEYVDSFYALNTNAGSPNVSMITSASFFYGVIREYSYTGSALAFDVANSGFATTGANSAVSLTTATDHELLVGLVITDTGTVSAAPSGWSDFKTSGASYNDGSADLVDAGLASGGKSANFTFPASGNWAETVVAFKDVTGGGGMPDTLSFFTQPSNTVTGSAFSPAVVIHLNLAAGGVDTASSAVVSLTINGCGASLTGTTTATASMGVATFTGLGVSTVATSCILTAASTGLVSVASNAFDVTTIGGGGGITYFGEVNATTGALNWSVTADQNMTAILWNSYTCTGTGSQDLLALGVWLKSDGFNGLPTVAFRLGIYDATGTTKIAESATLTSDGSTTYRWWEQTFSGITLTAGTTYRLAVTVGGTSPGHLAIGSQSTPQPMSSSYKLTDYSSGLPASLPAPDGSTYAGGIRATVQPHGTTGTPAAHGMLLTGVGK